MENATTSVVDICDRLVRIQAFPDATAFWLGFLTYAYRNRLAVDMARVREALAWVETGGLADADAPQTHWFYHEFCRLEMVVEEARSYLHFRGLDQVVPTERSVLETTDLA
jgi:hypothetical protein